jgi:RecG-like helicase
MNRYITKKTYSVYESDTLTLVEAFETTDLKIAKMFYDESKANYKQIMLWKISGKNYNTTYKSIMKNFKEGGE